LEWLPRSVLGGLLLAAALVAAARWQPLLTARELILVTLGLMLCGLVIGVLIILTRRRTLWQQARFADRQFRLHERTATAVEIHDGRIVTTPTLARQQLADTLAAVQSVDTPRQFPLRLNRQDWLVMMGTLILLAVAILLPNPQEATLHEQRAVAESIGEEAAALEALPEEIANNKALTPEQQAALQAPVDQALHELTINALSREAAVAALSEAEADLRALEAAFSQESLRENLAAAAQSLAANENAAPLGETLQAGALGQSGAAAAQLADDLAALTDDQQQALAGDLAETAAALQNLDGELAGAFNQAAEALERRDTAAAQEALREASGLLQQRQQEMAAAAQAGSAAQQLADGRANVAEAGRQEGAEIGEQGGGRTEGSGDLATGDTVEEGAEGVTPLNGEEQSGAGELSSGSGSGANVFVPDSLDLSGFEGTDIELPAECLADPAACGSLLEERPADIGEEGSLVPYEQVFGDYRDAANEALSEEPIPLGLRGLVREYFSSLEP
jgi:hypothetical protein